MKRKKRKYIFLIIASVILLFSIAILYKAIEKVFLYGKAQATIVSVDTEERVGGTSDDHYYYTESKIKCSYIVNGTEYKNTYTIKADYSGQEGNTIAVLYDKTKPFESVPELKSTRAFLYSIVFTVCCISYIFFDIRNWIKIRKQENAEAQQTYLSDADMQQYESKKKKQKIINIILIIASVLLFLPLSVIVLPLIVLTIARVIDYRLCYKSKVMGGF